MSLQLVLLSRNVCYVAKPVKFFIKIYSQLFNRFDSFDYIEKNCK